MIVFFPGMKDRWKGFRSLLLLLAIALVVCGTSSSLRAQMTNDECLGCHNDPSMTKEVAGKQVSLEVKPDVFGNSIHGSLSCTDCHASITAVPHENVKAVDCSMCHSDEMAAWQSSVHGKAVAAGNKKAAGCLDCHGSPHAIVSGTDPKSQVFHKNVPATCGRCHSQKFVMEPSGLTTTPVFSYAESVHGMAVARGDGKAAVCSDCHGSHAILPPNDPKSSIFKFNVPATCGKCHGPVAKEYLKSVHGKAVQRGNWQSPVCTDCHGIHMIRPHIDPKSSVASQAVARTTCGQCHGGVRLTQEFGVPAERLSTYLDSYHGLAKEIGSKVAANCASCHGVHNILPSDDPESTVNKANLARTCGKCHPGATENFTKGKIHVQTAVDKDMGAIATYWVRIAYIGIISGTLGFMILHNLIIWVWKARKARKSPSRVVMRMNKIQRIQHFLLLTSFFTLVVTGFALKYPNGAFSLLFGESEFVRSTIHRVAGVVMLLVGFFHIYYMVFTAEGRQGLKDFWFKFKDGRDLYDTMTYYLGLGKKPAAMGRFTYAEKIEYWALIWGTIVMGVTGLSLWFKVEVGNLVPRWWIDVATAVHFYEAILATAAIIIWHFYAVIFDPDVYPISWAWFDGKMSREHFEHEHKLAYDEWLRQQAEGSAARESDDHHRKH